MSFAVSSSESLLLMMTGDYISLFRKAYQILEGNGFSSIGGRDGFSVSGSSKVSSEYSSSVVTSSIFPSLSLSRSESGVSKIEVAITSSIGSIVGGSSVDQ